MKKITFAVCTLALTLCAEVYASTDGTVTFNGRLISETCSITEESKNIPVGLPGIAVQRLAKAGEQAGSTSFKIEVENCPRDISKVAAHFEAINSSGSDPATGNLNNSAKDSAAAGVQVRLYNYDGTHIPVGSTGKAFNVVNSAARLAYLGGYYAVGPSTAGNVTAQVQYVIAYP